MADLLALAAHGLPPLGLGRYVGSVVDDEPRFAFYVINAWRSGRDRLAARARELGGEVWLFGGPEHWEPGTWRASRQYIASEVRRMGAVGYIADPENGWPQLPRVERMRELRELGEALRDDALSMRVGVSFFPGMPDLGELADGAGPGVFGNVQVYGLNGFSRSTFARWVERAREHFGPARTSIAIAGWPARAEMETVEGYARYLSFLPDAPSNIVWNLGRLPPHIRSALSRRDVGGNIAGSAAWGVLALVDRPAGVVTLVLVALVVAVVVFAAWRSR